MSKQIQETKNPMQMPKLEKVTLSCGATGPDLEKSKKLLEMLTGKKAQILKAGPQRRIPSFGVKPNLPLGTRVTLRGKEAIEILKRLLGAVENYIDEDQIMGNTFSFGIKEYIEIPKAEYQRDIGIRGLSVTATFIKPGIRVKRKKIKQGKVPKRQQVSPEEIKEYMEENFNTEIA